MQMKVRPSKKLRELIAAHKSARLAALAWGVQPSSLERWLHGDGGITAATAAQLIESTGYGWDALFSTTK